MNTRASTRDGKTCDERKTNAERVHEHLLACRRGPTHERGIDGIRQFVAELTTTRLPCRLVERLGVEHQPIHVEHDRVDRHSRCLSILSR